MSSAAPALKKKRRRCGLRFSTTKQLKRSRMSKRAAPIADFDVGDTARVLSFDAEQCWTKASFKTVNEEHGSIPRNPKQSVGVCKNGDEEKESYTGKFLLI